MTTKVKLDKALEELQKNPYFSKYAQKIAKFQETDPEEFLQRIETQEQKIKEKEARLGIPKTCSLSMGTLLSPFMKQKMQWHHTTHRFYTTGSGNMYITTPIFYSNSSPHIGHLYTATIADVIARYNAMLGNSVTLAVGVDEHGTKVAEAAVKSNKIIPEYCDIIATEYQEMFRIFDIDYTVFTRTTGESHKKAVHQFWRELQKRDCIQIGNYSGWYCKADEAFVPNTDVTEKIEKGKTQQITISSGQPVEWTEETNFMFQLDKYQNDLKYWLQSGDVVQPAMFRNQLLNWIEDEAVMQPLSISRPATRVSWGIPVPDRSDHTIYVWLDALVSYLTSRNYPQLSTNAWPPDVQVIGKDILKFHGIYWPALLFAAGMEPPRKLLCHSHWTINKSKMSKSKGNVINPSDLVGENNPDVVRFYLLSQAALASDGDFTLSHFKAKSNELFGAYVNLPWRCLSERVNKNREIPTVSQYYCHADLDRVSDLVNLLSSLHEEAQRHYEEFKFHHVMEVTLKVLNEANAVVNVLQPWNLAKDSSPEKRNLLKATLALTLETTRICSLVLLPIIPKTANAMLDTLAVPRDERTWRFTKLQLESDEPQQERPAMIASFPRFSRYN